MEELETTTQKTFDKIMLGTIGVGLLGETIYYAVTGEILPGGETLPSKEFLTGFYRGLLEVGPATVLVGRKLVEPLVVPLVMRKLVEPLYKKYINRK